MVKGAGGFRRDFLGSAFWLLLTEGSDSCQGFLTGWKGIVPGLKCQRSAL